MKLEKRIIVGLSLVTFLFCGCKEKGSEVPEKTELERTETAASEQKVEQEEPVTQDKEETLLTDTYKVPGQAIYVDVPDMHPIESGFTQVYFEDLVKYVTFTCIQVETAQDEKEAFGKVFGPFINSMSGLDIINHLGEITGENLTVNGLDVYFFEGKLNCGTNPVYDAYIRGYSFICEGMPCALIGVVMDEEQSEEEIEAVKELVDAMMDTVRSKRDS